MNFRGRQFSPYPPALHIPRSTDSTQTFSTVLVRTGSLWTMLIDSLLSVSTEKVAKFSLTVIFIVPFTVVYEGQGGKMMPKLESANECLSPHFCPLM